jgi:prepilin-type N-terminal cleavage/methylation domain-containing protein
MCGGGANSGRRRDAQGQRVAQAAYVEFTGPTELMIGNRRVASGFTLLELVIVTVVVAIAAAVAIPRFSNYIGGQRADGAARRIVADLRVAQQRAKYSAAAMTVNFDGAGGRYELVGMNHPDHPDQPYIVTIGDEPYRAKFLNIVLGADTSIIFDGYGNPDSGGQIRVAVGDAGRLIDIDATTGRISFAVIPAP